MAYTKALYEIIEEVRKSKNVKIKAEILKANESTSLIDIFQLTYNPAISWLLPEGTPPYTPAEGVDPDGNGTDLEGALFGKIRMMKYFIAVNGAPSENIPPVKREKVFIQVLESIAPKDAKLVIEMKDRSIKGVTALVVQKAFPQIQINQKTA